MQSTTSSSSTEEALMRISDPLKQRGFSIADGAGDQAAWIDSVIEAVASLCADLDLHHDTSVLSGLDHDHEARLNQELQNRIKLLERENRLKLETEKALQNKVDELEIKAKKLQAGDGEQVKAFKSKIRSLESLLQESDRRMNQKEREFNRLREKFKSFIEKDHSHISHKETSTVKSANFKDPKSNNERKSKPGVEKIAIPSELELSVDSGNSNISDQMVNELRKEVAVLNSKGGHLDQRIQQLHQINLGLQDQLENAQIEIQSRPTVKQWNEAQKQIQEAELQIRSLATLRSENKSIELWRSHLSSSDRMRIDKRNHELELWLIESTPKSALVEIVQFICRELDISNVANIPSCLKRLKSVVRAVPQMEKFIHKIVSFVGDRNSNMLDQLGADTSNCDKFCCDNVLPTLQRWWGMCQRCIELERLKDTLLFELFRGEFLLSHPKIVDVNLQQIRSEWTSSARGSWLLKSNLEVQERLKSLVDLEVDIFMHSIGRGNIQTFVTERPDLVNNRILCHILYLFDIKSTEDILHTMNQLYLFTEEMKNFIVSLKSTLKCDESSTSSAVMNEALRIVAAHVH